MHAGNTFETVIWFLNIIYVRFIKQNLLYLFIIVQICPFKLLLNDCVDIVRLCTVFQELFWIIG